MNDQAKQQLAQDCQTINNMLVASRHTADPRALGDALAAFDRTVETINGLVNERGEVTQALEQAKITIEELSGRLVDMKPTETEEPCDNCGETLPAPVNEAPKTE